MGYEPMMDTRCFLQYWLWLGLYYSSLESGEKIDNALSRLVRFHRRATLVSNLRSLLSEGLPNFIASSFSFEFHNPLLSSVLWNLLSPTSALCHSSRRFAISLPLHYDVRSRGERGGYLKTARGRIRWVRRGRRGRRGKERPSVRSQPGYSPRSLREQGDVQFLLSGTSLH